MSLIKRINYNTAVGILTTLDFGFTLGFKKTEVLPLELQLRVVYS